MDIPDRKLAPDDRRKDRISAETGHRKDVKKGGAGGKGNLGRPVRAAPRNRPLVARDRAGSLLGAPPSRRGAAAG
jgi:hypothetical protein